MIPRNLVTRRLTYDCLGLPGSDPPSVPWMAAVDCGSVNNSDAPQKGVRQPPSHLLLWSSAVCCAGACTGWTSYVREARKCHINVAIYKSFYEVWALHLSDCNALLTRCCVYYCLCTPFLFLFPSLPLPVCYAFQRYSDRRSILRR